MTDQPDSSLAAVFLDTQVFVEQNFQYGFGPLAAFGQHVRAGRIDHVTTEVTVGEVQKKISEGVEEARKALRRFQRDAKVLRNSRSTNVARRFKPLGRKQTESELREQLSDFISGLETTIVDVDIANPSEVFRHYFEGRPPFGNLKKKSEFPDAFAMESLRTHADRHNRRIIVVSRDKDWATFVKENPRFDIYEGLEDLLHDLQQDSTFFNAALAAVASLEEQFMKAVSHEVVELDFFVADAPAAIVDVMVDHITLREPQIVDASDESFIWTTGAYVEFEVAVDYFGRSLASAPSGLGTFRVGRIQPSPDEPAILNAYEQFGVVGTAEWDSSDPRTAKLLGVRIADPRPVPVYHDEYTGS